MTNSGRKSKYDNDWVAYGAIALFVALSYILLVGRYVDYLNNVLPHGDPFTYTISWFQVIDYYRAHGYLHTLHHNLSDGSGWYRLMEVSEATLAPILAKKPFVICIVNYVLFGIATIAFYRLGRRLGSTIWVAFAIALIPWLWPINYGFEDQTSLPVTALDAAFNAALLWAVAQAYIFVLDLRLSAHLASVGAAHVPLKQASASFDSLWTSRKDLRGAAGAIRAGLVSLWRFRGDLRYAASAILTGLVIGIAVWGRGNSLPVVALVVLWPGLLALWLAWRSHDAKVWAYVIVAGVIASLIAIQFYIQYWASLHAYYGVHSALINRYWTLDGAKQFILNVPGFMYWRVENSPVCVVLTLASHLFVLSMFAIAWGPRGLFAQPCYFAFRHLVTGGAAIYFGTYLIDMALFANGESGLSIYQALLVWRPMLIGLSLILVAIIAELFAHYTVKLDYLTPLPLAALALGWGLMWTDIYTPWELKDRLPSPRTVERFAVNLDHLTDGGEAAILWYGGWNEPILNYYRLENELQPGNFLSWTHRDAMWSMSDYTEEKRARVLEQVKFAFSQASLIVIPEFLDEYRANEYYAFYKFKNDWAAWLNSDEAPRFRVVMLLRDSPTTRLLVIRRDELAKGQGDPLRLPYGDEPEAPAPDYSDAVSRFN
jgi:hypothetical protein